jgi:hypothetical protein
MTSSYSSQRIDDINAELSSIPGADVPVVDGELEAINRKRKVLEMSINEPGRLAGAFD